MEFTQTKIQPTLQKRERERRLYDVKFKKYNTKTYIKKKKPSTLIRVVRKNKNPPREREREHSQFFRRKNMDWMREMISNLYKNKIGEKKSQNIGEKNDEV